MKCSININSQAVMMFRNEDMETHDIHNLITYNAYHNFSNISVSIRKTTNAENDKSIQEIQKALSFTNTNTRNNPTQYLKSSISYIPPLLETEITMSVEKDLNIIVTTVKNKNTDKVIRQIPNEELVERLKYLKKYNNQLIFQKEKDVPTSITTN